MIAIRKSESELGIDRSCALYLWCNLDFFSEEEQTKRLPVLLLSLLIVCFFFFSLSSPTKIQTKYAFFCFKKQHKRCCLLLDLNHPLPLLEWNVSQHLRFARGSSLSTFHKRTYKNEWTHKTMTSSKSSKDQHQQQKQQQQSQNTWSNNKTTGRRSGIGFSSSFLGKTTFIIVI